MTLADPRRRPEGWTQTSLGEIAKIDTGFPFKSDLFTKDTAGVRLLRGDNVGQGRLDWSRPARWPATASVEPKFRLRDGDVVIAMDRPWVGAGLKRAVVRATDVPSLLVQRVARLRARQSIDQGFLGCIVNSKQFSRYLVSVQTGTAIPHISSSQIAGYSFALPPLPEQQAIAEVLSALDDKIVANTKLAATADALAVTRVASSLDSDTALLEEVAEITMGSSPKGETLNESGQGIPFFQGVRDFGFRTPVQRVFTTAPVRFAEPGDILLSVRAPVGTVNLTSGRVCIGRGVAAVRSREHRNATLFHLLRSERPIWEPYEAEGTVFGSISRRQLRSLSLRVPRQSEANRLESDLRAIETTVDAALAENRTLAATRDALLPQLLSGKLHASSHMSGLSS